MNTQNFKVRILFATAFFSAALVCLVWADAKSDQQQKAIQTCKDDYDSGVFSCWQQFLSDAADYNVQSYNNCVAIYAGAELTCFNGTIAAVVSGQSPPPRATAPPGATAPTGTTNPISAPIPGPSAAAPPNATATPVVTATPRKTHPRPPHKGSSPTPTASHPILLSKPKSTPIPTPTPTSSPHNKKEHHH